MENISVIVLCGGRGSRMKGRTEIVPKPLVEISGRPMLAHILDNLYNQNFKNIVLATGYLSTRIQNFAKEFSRDKPDLQIEISDSGVEASMLKRIYDCKPHFAKNNLIIYGDTFLHISFKELICKHILEKPLVTLVTGKIQNPFGILEINSQSGQIMKFTEKPTFDYYIGSFVFQDKLLEKIPLDLIQKKDGIGLVELFNILIDIKNLFAYQFDGLQVSFNTEYERIEAEKNLSSFYTIDENRH